MISRFSIVGIGEALFDVFPEAYRLGGAPLNVAVCAHQMAAVRQGRGVVVSRVGQDDLGRQVLDELQQRGVETYFMQTDPDRDTGRVYVDRGPDGEPVYDIVSDVAWDWLQYDPDLDDLARRSSAVCFGSLAQRVGQTRNTIYRFLEAARQAVKLFDVNLRQDYFDQNVLRRSCDLATAVKLNEHELPITTSTLGLGEGAPDEMAHKLLRKYDLRHVVLTCGAGGTVLYSASDRIERDVPEYEKAQGADHVGAGDACTAGILVGMSLRMPADKIVDLANHAGAFVASQPGGTPTLPQSILDMVKGPASG